MKRVQVEWVDSVVDGSWQAREEALRRAAEPTVLVATSVGFLLADENDYLLLATSQMPDADIVQGCLQIPREAVREVKELRR